MAEPPSAATPSLLGVAETGDTEFAVLLATVEGTVALAVG